MPQQSRFLHAPSGNGTRAVQGAVFAAGIGIIGISIISIPGISRPGYGG